MENQSESTIVRNLEYILNITKKEAAVFRILKDKSPTIIPKSIMYKSQEYIVTSILDNAFLLSSIRTIRFPPDSEIKEIGKEAFKFSKIESISIPSQVTIIGQFAFFLCERLKSVNFLKDSKIKTIEEAAFSCSSIESFSLPSSIVEFKDGWCGGTTRLNNITIFQNESSNISYYENKYIIGKTNLNSDIFDILIFARRNIKDATIPSFIKNIAPYAFECCNKIQKIEISNVQIIGKFAFSDSSIKFISIPNKVTKICESSFSKCKKIEKFEILEDSELQLIEKDAFAYSSIKSISIPSHIKNIGQYAKIFK